MINFTESDFTTKITVLPIALQDKLLLLRYDGKFLSIINHKASKPQEVITKIERATRLTALGFASKQELFSLIEDAVKDSEETRYIFGEIDKTILVPNNFEGADDAISRKTEEAPIDSEEEGWGEENNSVAGQTNDTEANQLQNSNKTETAEDILKEIENPTPSALILSSAKRLPGTDVNRLFNTNTTAPTNKENQLDSKLTEPVIQTAKSTYYKVDPYREQA